MALNDIWLGSICALSSCILCQTLSADETVPFFSADGNQAANERIIKALSKPLPTQGLDFSETSLSDVVSKLRDHYQIEILIDGKSLEDLGMSPDQLISIHLRNMSLQSALKHMLEELELTYLVYNEVLLITTEERADVEMFVYVYPVADLIDPKFKPSKSEADAAAPELGPLIDILISSVSIDTWADNGGGEGDIRGLRPGLLVITQSQDVHNQIRGILAAIRRGKQFVEHGPRNAESVIPKSGELDEESATRTPRRKNSESEAPFAE